MKFHCYLCLVAQIKNAHAPINTIEIVVEVSSADSHSVLWTIFFQKKNSVLGQTAENKASPENIQEKLVQ
ncbi:MAG: hypothetical protein DRQ39_03090 [Gammaproteobacteria bacterium]|nr:MAG: hypothetical protein DRQ39_03090 [Gammaproteobacteria bacterium]RKZ93816.1 MAG: hypothetical protein DRQ40_07155 [Gammaproteobacteria bacterium]RKZ97323.1 MAG: hypothetical protein DRQ46_05265 [Gammaproteobacteria bacterium]RLA01783.1 MAG: hypothetical protein DRQ42_02355 [Gammaproteobacteria bacterium]